METLDFCTKTDEYVVLFLPPMILDGTATAEKMLQSLTVKRAALAERGIHAKLVIILVGNNPASLSYIRQKEKYCNQIGIIYEQRNFDESITTDELIVEIESINKDSSVHGLIIQLPLPKHVEVPLILRAIDPKKDVDGFTAYNLGKTFLSADFEHLPPATPKGVIHLLNTYNIELQGKEVVVVGHSNIVGKPMAVMLLNRNATVTVCHYYTKNLGEHTKKADIIICAVGKRNLITADMVKDGAVVVDVGINRIEDPTKKSGFRLVGDCDFENISPKAYAITPVPGGVGPMTVATLMENIITATQRQHQLIS